MRQMTEIILSLLHRLVTIIGLIVLVTLILVELPNEAGEWFVLGIRNEEKETDPQTWAKET